MAYTPTERCVDFEQEQENELITRINRNVRIRTIATSETTQ
jgi:hypothetical protein